MPEPLFAGTGIGAPRVNIQISTALRYMPFGRIFTASLIASLAPLLGLSALASALGAPGEIAGPFGRASQTYTLVDLLRSAAQLESGSSEQRQAAPQRGQQRTGLRAKLAKLREAGLGGFDSVSPAILSTRPSPDLPSAIPWSRVYRDHALIPAPVSHLSPLRC